MNDAPFLLLTTSSYRYLSDGLNAGTIRVEQFPDGERGITICSSIKGKDVVLVGGTHSDAATLELYDTACAIAKYGARRLTIVIPYFGYSTQERAVRGIECLVKDKSAVGLEVVTAKCRARLISSIPAAGDGNRVILFDLHTEGLPHYFEGNIAPFHLYGKNIFLRAAKDCANGQPFCFASTDAGRAKWIISLSNDAGVSPAFAYKIRLSGSETQVYDCQGDVDGKVVILYDDMIRTGSSGIEAAKAYKAKGAAKIYFAASHGVLPNNSILKIKGCGLFSGVILTNSHPNAIKAKELAPDFVTIYDIMPEVKKLILNLP